MTWSYGDWHEDMVALYDDDTDQMVCWLQKKGGVDTKALTLIKAAPELLAVCSAIASDLALFQFTDGEYRLSQQTAQVILQSLRLVIAKAEGRE